jgi:hypothetical protein
MPLQVTTSEISNKVHCFIIFYVVGRRPYVFYESMWFKKNLTT